MADLAAMMRALRDRYQPTQEDVARAMERKQSVMYDPASLSPEEREAERIGGWRSASGQTPEEVRGARGLRALPASPGQVAQAINWTSLAPLGISPTAKISGEAKESLARLSGKKGEAGDVARVMTSLQEENLDPSLWERVSRHELTSPAFAEARPYLSPAELAKAARSSQTPAAYERMATELPPAAEMAQVARAGEAKRGWYAGSRAASEKVYGDEATRMAYLKAALSPQTSVETNLENAISTYRNWEGAGRPTAEDAIRKILGESVSQQPLESKPRAALEQLARRVGLDPGLPREVLIDKLAQIDPNALRQASVLESWVPNTVRALRGETLLSGPKVDSFAANLDPRNPFAPMHTTLDTWMARYADKPQTGLGGSLDPKFQEPGYSPLYSGMSARTRQAADLMGWAPEEIQETVWSWAKPIGESRGALGELPHASVINAVPDFQTLLGQERYRSRLTPQQAERAGGLTPSSQANVQFEPSRRERDMLMRARERVIRSYLSQKGE